MVAPAFDHALVARLELMIPDQFWAAENVEKQNRIEIRGNRTDGLGDFI
jgi:uncharacterized protein YdeI (BOF family)